MSCPKHSTKIAIILPYIYFSHLMFIPHNTRWPRSRQKKFSTGWVSNYTRTACTKRIRLSTWWYECEPSRFPNITDWYLRQWVDTNTTTILLISFLKYHWDFNHKILSSYPYLRYSQYLHKFKPWLKHCGYRSSYKYAKRNSLKIDILFRIYLNVAIALFLFIVYPILSNK